MAGTKTPQASALLLSIADDAARIDETLVLLEESIRKIGASAPGLPGFAAFDAFAENVRRVRELVAERYHMFAGMAQFHEAQLVDAARRADPVMVH